MRVLLTYVLAALAAAFASAVADLPRNLALWTGFDLADAVFWLVEVFASAVVFFAFVGPLWLGAQALLRRTGREARGPYAVGLGIGLVTALSVLGGLAMALLSEAAFGIPASMYGGLGAVLAQELVRGVLAGAAWGAVFRLRQARGAPLTGEGAHA